MAENAKDGSIIDPKYRDRYRNRELGWFDHFMNDNVMVATSRTKTVKDAEGNTTTEEVPGKPAIDMDKLFELAGANGVDAKGKYGDQIDAKNAAGRLRMTVGNMLRARAKARHGLYNVAGEWVEADEAFLDGAERTQERDGTKIPKAKPAKEAEAATEEAEESAEA